MKLWKNATFYQMTAEGDQVSAVLTENGHIYAVGEARELEINMRLILPKRLT